MHQIWHIKKPQIIQRHFPSQQHTAMTSNFEIRAAEINLNIDTRIAEFLQKSDSVGSSAALYACNENLSIACKLLTVLHEKLYEKKLWERGLRGTLSIDKGPVVRFELRHLVPRDQ